MTYTPSKFPPAAAQTWTATIASESSDRSAGWVTASLSGQTTIPKTGTYLIMARPSASDANHLHQRIYVAGNLVYDNGNNTGVRHPDAYVIGTYTAGDAIRFDSDFNGGGGHILADADSGMPVGTGNKIIIQFIPTAVYPQ